VALLKIGDGKRHHDVARGGDMVEQENTVNSQPQGTALKYAESIRVGAPTPML
jgi:hypothetical protein